MGPLNGKKVIELKGIGPGPYAGMLLADMGAEVIVVERSSETSPGSLPSQTDIHSRGKKSVALDLKSPKGVSTLLTLIESADVIFEGFRPGVMEKLGVGPEECLARNPQLVFGRMTGWGQTGDLSKSAGHDLNYISLTGAAAAIGEHARPMPPLNIVGDFAGGSLFLVMGILAALIEVQKSGKGQVVDTAITDGTANLMSMFYTLSNTGRWNTQRERNLLDGGTPFYRAYQTADDKFVSVAALEPHFFKEMLSLAGLPDSFSETQNDPSCWPEMLAAFTQRFAEKTRDEWVKIFEGSDACVAGILNYEEAIKHPHNVSRNTYIELDGIQQPAPAPRFSRTECEVSYSGSKEGADTKTVLKDWGLSDETIGELERENVLT